MEGNVVCDYVIWPWSEPLVPPQRPTRSLNGWCFLDAADRGEHRGLCESGTMETHEDGASFHPNQGLYMSLAYVQGDRPLSTGVHAWRCLTSSPPPYEFRGLLGIFPAGVPMNSYAWIGTIFTGIDPEDDGGCWLAGKWYEDSGLAEVRPGDPVDHDLLLDVDNRILTITTPKNGRRHGLGPLPFVEAGWLPHFQLRSPFGAVTVELEVIDPVFA